MRYNITRAKNALYFMLVVAILLVPIGMKKQAIADIDCKEQNKPSADKIIVGNDDDYTISIIRFFNWI